MEKISLELTEESWNTLFETIHKSNIEPISNFWASVQYLDAQLKDKTGKIKKMMKHGI